MIGLSADVDIADSVDLFGKKASDLQSGIAIDDNKISGTLNYISSGWDSGTWSEDEATGNYLAIHFEVPEVEGVSIQVTLTNPVTLDEDGIVVLRIRDKSSQSITVVASKEGYAPVTKVFYLEALDVKGA